MVLYMKMVYIEHIYIKIYIDIGNGKVSNMFGLKCSRFDYNQVQLCVHAVMSLYTNEKLGLLMCVDVATSTTLRTYSVGMEKMRFLCAAGCKNAFGYAWANDAMVQDHLRGRV